MKRLFRTNEGATEQAAKTLPGRILAGLQPQPQCRTRKPAAAATSPAATKSQEAARALFKSVDLASLFAGPADAPPPIQSVLPAPRPERRAVQSGEICKAKTAAQPQQTRAMIRTVKHSNRIARYRSQQRIMNQFQDEIHAILEHMRSSQRSLQTIGFTSVNPGEGVSTICSSLATLSAEMQKSFTWAKWHCGDNGNQLDRPHTVLLIDAQLHHPSLHTLFGVMPSPGLAAILAGAPVSASIQKVLPHLHIVTAGDVNKTFLTQPEWVAFAAFLNEARRHYTHIFVDLPALGSYPSGIDLARLCQAVTLVVEGGKTRRQSIQQVRTLLERNKVPILGGILNRRESIVPTWLLRRL